MIKLKSLITENYDNLYGGELEELLCNWQEMHGDSNTVIKKLLKYKYIIPDDMKSSGIYYRVFNIKKSRLFKAIKSNTFSYVPKQKLESWSNSFNVLLTLAEYDWFNEDFDDDVDARIFLSSKFNKNDVFIYFPNYLASAPENSEIQYFDEEIDNENESIIFSKTLSIQNLYAYMEYIDGKRKLFLRKNNKWVPHHIY